MHGAISTLVPVDFFSLSRRFFLSFRATHKLSMTWFPCHWVKKRKGHAIHLKIRAVGGISTGISSCRTCTCGHLILHWERNGSQQKSLWLKKWRRKRTNSKRNATKRRAVDLQTMLTLKYSWRQEEPRYEGVEHDASSGVAEWLIRCSSNIAD